MPLLDAESTVPQKRKTENENSNESTKQARQRIDFSKEVRRAPQTKKHKTWDGDAIVGITPGPNGTAGSFCTLYDEKGNVTARHVIPLENVKEGDLFRMAEREFQIDYLLSSNSVAQSSFEPTYAAKARPKSSLNKGLFKPFTSVKPNVPLMIPVELATDKPVNRSEPLIIDVDACEEGSWEISWRKSSTSKNTPWQEDGFLEIKGTTFRLLSDHQKLLSAGSWNKPWPSVGKEIYVSNRQIRINSVYTAELRCSINDETTTVSNESSTIPSLQTRSIQKFVPPTLKAVPTQKQASTTPRHDPEAEGAVVFGSPNKSHQAKHNKKHLTIVPVVIDPLVCKYLRPHQREGTVQPTLGDIGGLGKTLQTIALIWTLLKQSPYGGVPALGKCLIACPNWKKEFHKWIGKDRIGLFVGDKDKAMIKQFLNSKIHHVLIIGYERLKGVIHSQTISSNDLAYCQSMFEALKTPRRIILSGTPIQNNLEELHAMRLYESPIIKSRAPNCSKKELELGATRSAQKSLNSLISESTAKSLALITTLMNVSNNPLLLKSKNEDEKENDRDSFREAIKLLPQNADITDITLSGKMNMLANILEFLRQKTEEKCVIVSHFTSTLDIIQSYCEKKRYNFHRLDGRTQVNKRQDLVDHFNKSPQRECFLFLLSTKAGGVGLNLIGASRLVLFDSDWNPSHDLQAMARIHRSKGDSFTSQELRDLFTFHASTPCHTHELLGCDCEVFHDLNTNDIDLDSQDEDDLDRGWTMASQLDTEKVNRKVRFDSLKQQKGFLITPGCSQLSKRKKAELAILTREWIHVNGLVPGASEKIQDTLLKNIMSDKNPKEPILNGEGSANLTRAEQLLATIDAWQNQMTEESQGKYLDTSTISGGQITYIFEKKSVE
ncbi:hypothetical protein Clacol_000482 [Clathrus columnatus]|uniref:DNA repair and recombination protein RAD54B n=1 Tax=Clathrus columnatus TaxID=1419009 RepID=A0AAV5A122_9AGAM|nr:hypothetical protein Clacol_000482 [Clathrus columnatus]